MGSITVGARRFRLLMAALAAVLGVATAALQASSGSAGGASPATVTFAIDASTDHAPISPLIYGVNADATAYNSDYSTVVSQADPTVVRMGGDRWTAFNWENNASNAGIDYCVENDDFLDASSAPGAAVSGTIGDDDSAGIDTLVTIPIQGYVAADTDNSTPTNSTGQYTDCPQDVRNSPNYLTTRFDPEAPEDPAGPTATPAGTAQGDTVYQDDFAKWLQVHEPNWTPIFDLDNEPDYWSGDHPEVVTTAATYQQLTDDDIAYAKAIKEVDPNAEIAGPVLGGYYGLLTLDEPDQYTSSDYENDGDFTDYYLKQIAAANATAGHTLISDFDLHWYPQDPGVSDTTGTTAQDDAYREQWPRSLWDPTYTEESSSYLSGFGPIDLIPWLDGKIAADDPGMNLSFGEWDYGAGADISGAIATADTLGIFGKYGVHMATYWPDTSDDNYAYAAFRMFRNYDGDGNGFGDTEVKATNSDPVNTSVYASIDASDNHRMVIVAINKNTVDETATINIADETQYAGAKVYTLTAAGGAAPVEASSPLEPTSSNDTYSYEMPAQSVSVIVPAVAPPAPSLYADTPPADGVAGQAYTYTFGATGSPAPSFSVSSGALPPGLTLDPATGVLSGTPSTPGTYTFAVTASNGVNPANVSSSISVDVLTPASPLFTADTPPALTDVVTPYSYTFAAAGHPAASFAVAGGSLPPGMTLDASSGVLSGTATGAGIYTFTIEASNGISPAAYTPTLTIKVTAPLPGEVFAWGTTNGQTDLGTDSTLNPLIPEPVAFPAAAGPVVAIAQGSNHSLALTASGKVYGWGDDSDDELGDPSQTAEDSPVLVPFPGHPAPDIIAVAAGYEDSMALDSGGNVWTWGDDAIGELGNGTNNESVATPAEVDLSSVGGTDDAGKITAIAANAVNDYALTTGGNVVAWGDGSDGALGDGATATSDVPVAVSLGAEAGDITAIAARGTDHVLALTTAGSVLDWGDNESDELGNGTGSYSDTPVAVVGRSGTGTLTGVTAIGASGYDSYAIRDGVGLAWGANNLDQLGGGSTAQNSDVPVPLGEPTGPNAPQLPPLVGFTGGIYTSFALGDDGTLFGFGEDNQTLYGLVGDGQTNTTDQDPTQVTFPAGTDITQIAGSDADTLALTGGAEPTAPPSNTSLPTISGTAAAGGTLSCAPGTWSGDTPQTYEYKWLANGSAVDSFSSTATYVVPAAEAGDELSCVVEAGNDATTNQAESAVVQIAAGGGAPTTTTTGTTTGTTTTATETETTGTGTGTETTGTGTGTTGTGTGAGTTGTGTGTTGTGTGTTGAGTGTGTKTTTTTTTTTTPVGTPPTLSVRHITVTRVGVVVIQIACRGTGTCRGRLTLTLTTRTRGHGRHGRTATVTLGTVRYAVSAGGHETLRVHLPVAARTLLVAVGGHGLKVRIPVSTRSG